MKKLINASMGNWERLERKFEEQEKRGYELKKIFDHFAVFEKKETNTYHRYVFLYTALRAGSGDMIDLILALDKDKYATEIPTRFFPFYLYQIALERDEEVDQIKKIRRQKHILPHLRSKFLLTFLLGVFLSIFIAKDILSANLNIFELILDSFCVFLAVYTGFDYIRCIFWSKHLSKWENQNKD